jgi:hypothetical protein
MGGIELLCVVERLGTVVENTSIMCDCAFRAEANILGTVKKIDNVKNIDYIPFNIEGIRYV